MKTTFCIRIVGRNPDNPKSRKVGLITEQMAEIYDGGGQIAGTITTVQKDNLVLEIKK